MEMLEMDFLLGVIENTDGEDKNDVAMRRLSFNEVLRRNQQSEIDSASLTVYSVDEKKTLRQGHSVRGDEGAYPSD